MTTADLVHAALFDASVTEKINLSRAAFERLRGTLLEHLSTLPSGSEHEARLDPPASALVARAYARARETDRDAVASDLVAACVGRTEFPGALLQELAVRFDASSGDAGFVATSYRTTSIVGGRRVVMWDDDTTTMEHVIDVLTQCFGMCAVEACVLMLTVHDEGAASLGVFGGEEAADLLVRATTFSSSRRMPLRFTIEPIDFHPPARSWWDRARQAVKRP